MSLFHSLGAGFLSWWQAVPLPSGDLNAPPTFQSWRGFDATCEQWTPINITTSRRCTDDLALDSGSRCSGSGLPLVTWNVDTSLELAWCTHLGHCLA